MLLFFFLFHFDETRAIFPSPSLFQVTKRIFHFHLFFCHFQLVSVYLSECVCVVVQFELEMLSYLFSIQLVSFVVVVVLGERVFFFWSVVEICSLKTTFFLVIIACDLTSPSASFTTSIVYTVHRISKANMNKYCEKRTDQTRENEIARLCWASLRISVLCTDYHYHYFCLCSLIFCSFLYE